MTDSNNVKPVSKAIFGAATAIVGLGIDYVPSQAAATFACAGGLMLMTVASVVTDGSGRRRKIKKELPPIGEDQLFIDTTDEKEEHMSPLSEELTAWEGGSRSGRNNSDKKVATYVGSLQSVEEILDCCAATKPKMQQTDLALFGLLRMGKLAKQSKEKLALAEDPRFTTLLKNVTASDHDATKYVHVFASLATLLKDASSHPFTFGEDLVALIDSVSKRLTLAVNQLVTSDLSCIIWGLCRLLACYRRDDKSKDLLWPGVPSPARQAVTRFFLEAAVSLTPRIHDAPIKISAGIAWCYMRGIEWTDLIERPPAEVGSLFKAIARSVIAEADNMTKWNPLTISNLALVYNKVDVLDCATKKEFAACIARGVENGCAFESSQVQSIAELWCENLDNSFEDAWYLLLAPHVHNDFGGWSLSQLRDLTLLLVDHGRLDQDAISTIVRAVRKLCKDKARFSSDSVAYIIYALSHGDLGIAEKKSLVPLMDIAQRNFHSFAWSNLAMIAYSATRAEMPCGELFAMMEKRLESEDVSDMPTRELTILLRAVATSPEGSRVLVDLLLKESSTRILGMNDEEVYNVLEACSAARTWPVDIRDAVKDVIGTLEEESRAWLGPLVAILDEVAKEEQQQQQVVEEEALQRILADLATADNVLDFCCMHKTANPATIAVHGLQRLVDVAKSESKKLMEDQRFKLLLQLLADNLLDDVSKYNDIFGNLVNLRVPLKAASFPTKCPVPQGAPVPPGLVPCDTGEVLSLINAASDFVAETCTELDFTDLASFICSLSRFLTTSVEKQQNPDPSSFLMWPDLTMSTRESLTRLFLTASALLAHGIHQGRPQDLADVAWSYMKAMERTPFMKSLPPELKSLFKEIAKSSPMMSPDLWEPQHVDKLVKVFSKIGIDYKTRVAVAESVATCVEYGLAFEPAHVCGIVKFWNLAKLQKCHTEAWYMLVAPHEHNDFGEWDLRQLSYFIASLGPQIVSDSTLFALVRATKREVQNKSSDVNSVFTFLTYVTRLTPSDEVDKVVTSLLDIVSSCGDKLSPSNLCMFAWTASRYQVASTGIYDLVERGLHNKLNEVPVRDLANLVWAVAQNPHGSRAFFEELLQESALRAGSMNEPQLRSVLTACVTRQIFPRYLRLAFYDIIRKGEHSSPLLIVLLQRLNKLG